MCKLCVISLGVFAPSSDEEDETEYAKSKFSGGKKKADYSVPVSFISGGIKKGNKIELTDVCFYLN